MHQLPGSGMAESPSGLPGCRKVELNGDMGLMEKNRNNIYPKNEDS